MKRLNKMIVCLGGVLVFSMGLNNLCTRKCSNCR